jgi:hypothetical protein
MLPEVHQRSITETATTLFNKIPIAELPEINKQLYLVNYVQNQEWPKHLWNRLFYVNEYW